MYSANVFKMPMRSIERSTPAVPQAKVRSRLLRKLFSSRYVLVGTAVVFLCGCSSLQEFIHNGCKVGPNYAPPPAPISSRSPKCVRAVPLVQQDSFAPQSRRPGHRPSLPVLSAFIGVHRRPIFLVSIDVVDQPPPPRPPKVGAAKSSSKVFPGFNSDFRRQLWPNRHKGLKTGFGACFHVEGG